MRKIVTARVQRNHFLAPISAVILAAAFAAYSLPGVTARADDGVVISKGVSQRVAEVLAGRHVDLSTKWPGGPSRGLRDLYRDSVSAVPLVITQDTFGSSVVVHTDRRAGITFAVTNHHVVTSPFLDQEQKVQFVMLVFYEPALATTVLDLARVGQCLTQADKSASCSTLRSVTRLGVIVASDASRDLALLAIRNAPQSVRPIAWGKLDLVKPGDDVLVIGHPLGLLWSLTTGIVSGIRVNYQISDSPVESTVIQTQTPVNPGNSGGPLLTSEGQLIGVIFGRPTVSASGQNPRDNIRVAAPGLNLAVGVNEVQEFLTRRATGPQ